MKLENETLIKKFLFDEMAEQERFDFEERFITDANLFEEIKGFEDELIEKYVRGWMDPAERSKFEKYFLTTNKRRERVEFSRQMILKIEEQKNIEPAAVKKNAETSAADESIWDKLAGLFSTPKIALAGALTLIIAVLGSWLLYTGFSGKPEIVKNENNQNLEVKPNIETPKPSVSSVETPDYNQNDSENVNIEKSGNSKIDPPVTTKDPNENINKPSNKKTIEPKKTPTPTKTPPIQKSAPNPILALFAGTVRSGGKNNVLNLPKEAKAATLQLNLESNDYKMYSAQLTDADGNILFQRGNLNARKSKINFTIPAANLKKGDYIIKVFGKNNSGENESVADYQFRVNQ